MPHAMLEDKIQEHFPSIRHAALLYNAHLVYTNLALSDMRHPFALPAPGTLSMVCFQLQLWPRVLYSYLMSFNGAVSSHKLNRPPFGPPD